MKKHLIVDQDEVIDNFWQKIINTYPELNSTTFFVELKRCLFKDKPYLEYREELKRNNNNLETYHYFFDWFEQQETQRS